MMRTIIAYAGALLAAGLSSACCWIPLLLSGASAGALGLGTALEPFRPYLIGLTFAFLGMAFYFTYRPQRAPADCCAVPTSTTKRFQKAVLWLITLWVLFSLLAPPLLLRHAAQASVPAAASTSLQTVTFRVDRIACQSCAALITQRLRTVPGVHQVDVDIAKRQVLVRYDPRQIQPPALHTALQQAGFPAKMGPISQPNTTVELQPHPCCQ